jgi:hypothetical protein
VDRAGPTGRGIKLPATTVLPVADVPLVQDGPQDISYRREGAVGHLTFSFYNGAAGVDQCRRSESALRCAAQQDTRVLVLRSGPEVFAAARRSFVGKNRFRPATDGLVVSGDHTDFDDFIDDNPLRDMWGLAPHA